MTIIVEQEELPQGFSFKCRIHGVTYLIIKRGKRNAKEKAVKVYSDSDHTIIAETMQKYEEQTSSEQLIPQYSF